MSSAPRVIDWLVANHPKDAGGDTWLVSDGWPDTTTDRMIIIGSGGTEPAADGVAHFAFLGAPQYRAEDYTIPIEWHAATGDTNQKTVRDAVYAAKTALDRLLRADPTMGGTVDGCASELTAESLVQTDEDQAPDGRAAVLICAVHIRNTDLLEP